MAKFTKKNAAEEKGEMPMSAKAMNKEEKGEMKMAFPSPAKKIMHDAKAELLANRFKKNK